MSSKAQHQGPLAYPSLNHPALVEEWNEGVVRLNDAQEIQLRSRFLDTGVNQRALVAAVEQAGRRANETRYAQELININLLSLDKEEQAEQLSQYRALAGEPSRAGEYIQLFGQWATTAFTSGRVPDGVGKVALDLGGESQFGVFGLTEGLDKLEWSLPAQLVALVVPGGNINVQSLRGSRELFGYRITPLILSKETGLEFVMVRRRRGVVDVREDGRQVEVYKQSLGVVPLKRLSLTLRNMLQEVFSPTGSGSIIQNNTLAARMVGKLFEEDIDDPDKVPGVVAPVGAHLVMAVLRHQRHTT